MEKSVDRLIWNTPDNSTDIVHYPAPTDCSKIWRSKFKVFLLTFCIVLYLYNWKTSIFHRPKRINIDMNWKVTLFYGFVRRFGRCFQFVGFFLSRQKAVGRTNVWPQQIRAIVVCVVLKLASTWPYIFDRNWFFTWTNLSGVQSFLCVETRARVSQNVFYLRSSWLAGVGEKHGEWETGEEKEKLDDERQVLRLQPATHSLAKFIPRKAKINIRVDPYRSGPRV